MQRIPITFSTILLILSTVASPGQVFIDQTLPSTILGANRTIHICLPASYTNEPSRRYPVLYLHDGQNVFSPAGPNVAFGWGNWSLDRTAAELSRAGKMREVIMVGVENSPARLEEYNGRNRASNTNALTPFDKYSAFLIEELKPRIDHDYRTLRGPSDTGVMGSSMGGLCSLALGWQHPEVFGRVACLSSAFQVDHTNFLNSVLRNYDGPPKPLRIYLDSGVTDFMGGDDGRVLSGEAAGELVRIEGTGNLMYYVDLRPLSTEEMEKAGLRRDKWKEAGTSQHNEFYWRLRSWRPLGFLFPPPK
jgi:predicted alpha/beta superfamily hydrolase